MVEAKELSVVDQLIGNKAYMLLNAPMGYDAASTEPYINGGTFAQRMYELKSQGYQITVKINSPGGQVTDGFSIIDAIKTTGADTHIIGLAASMAGICALMGAKRKADDGTCLMAHPAQGGNSSFKDIVRNTLSGIMEKRTRMPVDKINEMMNSSGMHWFNSNEMLEHGMIDEIVPTEQKFIKPLTTNAFDLYKVYNNLNNENNMDFKEIMKGLFPGKSDAEMVTNTISLNTENSVLKAEVEKLKAKLAEAEVIIEQSTKSVKEVIVKNLIESAIDAGKIKEDRKSFWTAAALSDLEGVKAELEIMQVKAATKTKSAMSVIGTASPAKDETETYAYLTKNNPAKLQQMLVTDPEHFEKLLDEYNPKENK